MASKYDDNKRKYAATTANEEEAEEAPPKKQKMIGDDNGDDIGDNDNDNGNEDDDSTIHQSRWRRKWTSWSAPKRSFWSDEAALMTGTPPTMKKSPTSSPMTIR
jgi:hypothetical protein